MNYTNFEVLNEEMSAMATNRLRDAIHDVIVELKRKETLEIEELSKKLADEYSITISPFFLDKFLDDFMKAKRGIKTKTIFSKSDARWLGVRDNKGAKEVRNNLLYLRPNLAKYKRKLFSEEEAQKLENAYKDGMKELNFKEDVIKNSYVLQTPGDSKEMIKSIYSDIVIDKKYYNTYDNCWKLMMLMGKRDELDRKRGWFRFAPPSIKDDYKTKGRFNYELQAVAKEPIKKKKPENKPDTETKVEPKAEQPVLSSKLATEENLAYLDKNYKYNDWKEFRSSVGLSALIKLIDGLKTNKDVKGYDLFLDKTTELTYILRKYYLVDKADIHKYYIQLGLNIFITRWQKSGQRPKINDF
jgi:hypothetical protein